jgi:DNA-binding beta-propeller fold protein YncE
MYSINASTGALTSITTAIASGANPYGVAVDPTGRFVYVANITSSTVSMYSLGYLTALSVTTTIQPGAYTVAALPAGVTGAIVYVTDQLTTPAAKGVAPVGGGAVTCMVIYNGAAWVGI